MEDWTDLFKERTKNELGEYVPENANPKDSSNLSEQVSKEVSESLALKKFKKLKHQISYLNMEHDDTKELFKHAQKLFVKTMLEYCSRKEIEPPLESYTPKKECNKKAIEQIKDLYREIAKKTHPDKIKDLPDSEVEVLVDLYNKATQGKISGDFNEVLGVALNLDIQIQDISPEMLESISEGVKDMEKKIRKMKNDTMYKWFYASPKQQQKIFEALTKNQKPINQ